MGLGPTPKLLAHRHAQSPPRMLGAGPLDDFDLQRSWGFNPFRPTRQPAPLQLHPAIDNLLAPVPQHPHNDLALDQAQRLVLPVQLVPLPTTGDRPVRLHHPFFFPTQNLVPVARHGLMRIQRAGGNASKLPVQSRQILPQILIPADPVVNPRQPQFLYQRSCSTPFIRSTRPLAWGANCA